MPIHHIEGHLVTASGHYFEGSLEGHVDRTLPVTGELVFNTALAGYQEVITDPSYAGQIVTFTYPHIGNYGVRAESAESDSHGCNGLVVRQLSRLDLRHLNTSAEGSLPKYLEEKGLTALTGVDTRRLTRVIREVGSMGCAYGSMDIPKEELAELARATPDINQVPRVSTAQAYEVGNGNNLLAVYDFGVKLSIIRRLLEYDTRLLVVPHNTPAEAVLASHPKGVVLSNGPGDPRELPVETQITKDLIDKVPLFGICLGHQLVAAALGGSLQKLKFGHHGGNHPIRDTRTGKIDITSQNHNYAVGDIPEGVQISKVNLNDQVIEGLSAPDLGVESVQYHPEGAPGPHDSFYIFADFAERVGAR